MKAISGCLLLLLLASACSEKSRPVESSSPNQAFVDSALASEAADHAARIREAASRPDQLFHPQYRVVYPEPMQELIRESFALVPGAIALLEGHTKTQCFFRYTNTTDWPPERFLTLGEYAAVLIDAVSGRKLLDWKDHSLALSPEVASRWWQTARQTGEKEYLAGALRQKEYNIYCEGVATALVRKFPEVLADFYRKWVEPPVGPDEFLSALINESSLPVKEKRELFERGLQSRYTFTRITALRAMHEVDAEHAVQILHDELRSMPHPRRDDVDFWGEVPEAYGSGYAHAIAALGLRDDETWSLLVEATRRCDPYARTVIIEAVFRAMNPDASADAHFRFAASFIEDDEPVGKHFRTMRSSYVPPLWAFGEVWRHVCMQLNEAWDLGFQPDEETINREWEPLRQRIRATLAEDGVTAFDS